ncbi:TagF domain-containing protein [Cereibacter sphaeroides]|uniref:TagF domain-containing protein n=1 Tax=Cereibacter sphaeroides TaxID=1063 RepID=UPI003990A4BC
MASERATAGFFGKLPSTGDFVTRGLSPAFRAAWDGWITRHVAGRLGAGPEGGLRVRLRSGGRVAGGVVLPGRDRIGRSFPLSLLLVADGLPGPEGFDPWCEAARAAAAVHPEPDALWQALSDIPVPEGDAAAAPPLLLWTGKASAACDPRNPAEALERLLGTR